MSSRFGYDAVHRENAFSLTFPEKCVPSGSAHVTTGLPDHLTLDEVSGDHRDGKRDRDGVAFGVFRLEGSITMPPASGFAFDVSSASSSCAKLAGAKQ